MAIVVVPESISFAYMAGMDPITGLYGTFFVGFIAAAVGGRPATISGCSGAMCVILKVITSDTGPLKDHPIQVRKDTLLLTVIFSGVFQIIFGMLKLGQLVRLIPQSAMIGFVNGLAMIIFISQLPSFQICDMPPTIPKPEMFKDCPEMYIRYIHLTDLDSWLLLICVLLCTLCIFLFPRIPYVGKYVPASLIALILGTGFEHGIVRAAIGLETRILENTAPIKGAWPTWYLPSVPNTTEIWSVIIIYGVYSALVAAVESIMTVSTICEVLDTRVDNMDLNQECIAQGLGNFVAGFFGSIGGNAMIGESNLNVISGARHRLSAMVMSWVLLFIVVWLSPIVNLIPLASLTGVILSITFHTFYWPCLWTMHRMRKSDTIIIILTTVLSIVTNLVISVGVGFLLASITLTWDSYNMLRVHTEDKETIVCSCLLSTVDSSKYDGTNNGDEGDLSEGLGLESMLEQVIDQGLEQDLEQKIEIEIDTEKTSSIPTETILSETKTDNLTHNDNQDFSFHDMSSQVTSYNNNLNSNANNKDNDIDDKLLNMTQNTSRKTIGKLNYGKCERIKLKTRTYHIEGPIFFGSSNSLLSHFTPSLDPLITIVDLEDSSVNDYSASSVLCKTVIRYQSLGKIIFLENLTPKSVRQCLRSRDFMKLMKQTSPTSFRLLSTQEVEREMKKVGPIRAYFCGFEVEGHTSGRKPDVGIQESDQYFDDLQSKSTSKSKSQFNSKTNTNINTSTNMNMNTNSRRRPISVSTLSNKDNDEDGDCGDGDVDNDDDDETNISNKKSYENRNLNISDNSQINSLNSIDLVTLESASNLHYDKNANSKDDRIDVLDLDLEDDNLRDGLRNRTPNVPSKHKRIHHLQMFQPEMPDSAESPSDSNPH